MELLNNPQFHSQFASLGSMHGENYVVNGECMATLEEINMKLSMEDHTLRTYRRAIGFGQNVKKDIMPLLINVKDPKILDSAVRLVVNLTVPIECLLSVEVMSRTEIGRHTIYELNRLLHTSKEVFVDIKATKAIIDYMKHILESDHKLSLSQCESVNNCLLLLRNILHIPESVFQHQQKQLQPPQTSMQNQILWNLFTQSIDKLLIHLMSCPQKSVWGVTIVQLIALMYKDQHVGTLQKLLNHWFDAASFSETSDDNESNTSPPKLRSDDSSPMLTSDPTSDSSDTGSGLMATLSNTIDDNSRLGSTQLIRVKPKPVITQKSAESTTNSESTVFSGQDIIMKVSYLKLFILERNKNSCLFFLQFRALRDQLRQVRYPLSQQKPGQDVKNHVINQQLTIRNIIRNPQTNHITIHPPTSLNSLIAVMARKPRKVTLSRC